MRIRINLEHARAPAGTEALPVAESRRPWQAFCGIDWAEGHYDVALVDQAGVVLTAERRIDDDAIGYHLWHATASGIAWRWTKSDPGRRAAAGQHILRTERVAHRSLPADLELAQAIAVLARAQQDAVWNRQQVANQLRSLPGEYYPAFVEAFQGRDELVVYKHMWYAGAAPGAVRGLHHHGLAYAGRRLLQCPRRLVRHLTTGRWDEVAAYAEFMGYTQPWYSVRDVDAPVGDSMDSITCFLRDGDRVFLTYSTTGPGNEPINGSFGLLDLPPYSRGEAWEDEPDGWPGGAQPVLVLALGRGWERHLGPDQPPRAAVVDLLRRDRVETLGRQGHDH